MELNGRFYYVFDLHKCEQHQLKTFLLKSALIIFSLLFSESVAPQFT